MSSDDSKIKFDPSMITSTSTSINATGYVYQEPHYGGSTPRSRWIDYTDPISTVNADGEIRMNNNNIHIQPVNNGFLLTMTTFENGVECFSFESFEQMTAFISDNSFLCKDMEKVADSV